MAAQALSGCAIELQSPKSTDWDIQTNRQITAVTCTCSEYAPEPWQRPLLTQRRGARLDAQASRVQGGFVNGKPTRPGDASLALHLQSQRERSAGECPGLLPGFLPEAPPPVVVDLRRRVQAGLAEGGGVPL